MLRYVGKADRKLLMDFCDEHLCHFTPEGLRYALEKQPAAVRKQYAARLKELRGAAPQAQPKAPAKAAAGRTAPKRKRGK